MNSELMANLRSGNKMNESIRSLYRNYFDSLSWYVIYNHGNRQDAEDVFQEVVINFITLLQKDKFREESSIKTFLYSLNRHIWLNELKKRGRTLLREEKYTKQQESVEIEVSKLVEKRETRQQVTQLLDRVGEPCKKLLLLYYYENLSAKEILPYFEYENEQVIKNKKCKCQKQLNQIINKDPSLKRNLKNLLQEEKSVYRI